jgi:hypothetical protein
MAEKSSRETASSAINIRITQICRMALLAARDAGSEHFELSTYN